MNFERLIKDQVRLLEQAIKDTSTEVKVTPNGTLLAECNRITKSDLERIAENFTTVQIYRDSRLIIELDPKSEYIKES